MRYLVLVLLALQAPAITIYGPVMPVSGQPYSCGAYTRADPATRQALTLWVEGFLSGVNRERTVRHDPLKPTDARMIETWLSRHCGGHPFETIPEATIALVEELSR